MKVLKIDDRKIVTGGDCTFKCLVQYSNGVVLGEIYGHKLIHTQSSSKIAGFNATLIAQIPPLFHIKATTLISVKTD